MKKPPAHPFTIHIAPAKLLRSAFVWSIARSGADREYALITYATPEEARQAGKTVLDRMITAWHQKTF